MVAQARLKELLDYNPDTGVFTWRKSRGCVAAGSVAGCMDAKGYLRIRVDGKKYANHRLAWLYVYGEFPADQLDHINRVRNDNRICNLRTATQTENHQNTRKPRTNTSGVVGVCWDKSRGKWIAQITTNGRCKHLGYYGAIEEAAAARAAGKAKYHTFNPEDNNEEAA